MLTAFWIRIKGQLFADERPRVHDKSDEIPLKFNRQKEQDSPKSDFVERRIDVDDYNDDERDDILQANVYAPIRKKRLRNSNVVRTTTTTTTTTTAAAAAATTTTATTQMEEMEESRSVNFYLLLN